MVVSEGFNTQPPEGGWINVRYHQLQPVSFQHTAARRRLVVVASVIKSRLVFQHTAARRRLGAS